MSLLLLKWFVFILSFSSWKHFSYHLIIDEGLDMLLGWKPSNKETKTDHGVVVEVDIEI